MEYEMKEQDFDVYIGARVAGWTDCFEFLYTTLREEVLKNDYASVPAIRAFILGFTDSMEKGKEESINTYKNTLSEIFEKYHVQ